MAFSNLQSNELMIDSIHLITVHANVGTIYSIVSKYRIEGYSL